MSTRRPKIADIDLIDDEGRHHVPKRDIAELAERILDLFLGIGRSYVPRPINVRKKDLVYFYKAALLCMERKQTPEQFVVQQLEGMASIGTFWPRGIATHRFERTIDAEQQWIASKIAHYRSQLAIFLELASLYGPITTINDRTVDFTPLFKCVMAHHYKAVELEEKYRAAALVELQAVPIAAEVFGTMIEFLRGIQHGPLLHTAGADAAVTLDRDIGSQEP